MNLPILFGCQRCVAVCIPLPTFPAPGHIKVDGLRRVRKRRKLTTVCPMCYTHFPQEGRGIARQCSRRPQQLAVHSDHRTRPRLWGPVCTRLGLSQQHKPNTICTCNQIVPTRTSSSHIIESCHRLHAHRDTQDGPTDRHMVSAKAVSCQYSEGSEAPRATQLCSGVWRFAGNVQPSRPVKWCMSQQCLKLLPACPRTWVPRA